VSDRREVPSGPGAAPLPDLAALERFAGAKLAETLSRVEGSVRGMRLDDCTDRLPALGVAPDALRAAAALKGIAGQINVTIHALGILSSLPHLLEDGETVEYVSLGAGNTGRDFDLETDRRVGEFKFINWRGGPEAIRQNSIFKDFFLLAEHPTPKAKFLYVLGTLYPLKFLQGGRAIDSVLSKDQRIREMFYERYPAGVERVRDYFRLRAGDVTVVDVSPWLPELTDVGAD
jgi:hypothetical protein